MTEKLKQVPHTAEGLRDALFEELNELRAGTVTVGHARVVSQLARRIIEISLLELYGRQQLEKAKDVKRLVRESVKK